jgi:rubredoxin
MFECDLLSTSRSGLQQHIRSIHRFACEQCDYLATDKQLEEACSSRSGNLKEYQCVLCHLLFSQRQHLDNIGICLAMSSLQLPPYVLRWIIDWLPNYDRLSHHKKIRLIESVRASIWKIKGKARPQKRALLLTRFTSK